jgi:hypothetical protein
MLRRDDDPPWISPESALFSDIVDDQGTKYRLHPGGSSGASSSGAKRQRWDLRALLDPTPAPHVRWLRFTTAAGHITAELRPPITSAVSSHNLRSAPSTLEHYLKASLHQHVWLHLLDPDRPLAPLAVIGDALIAVEAIDPDDTLVAAIRALDAHLSGDPVTAAIPPTVAAALSRESDAGAWEGVAALGVRLEHPDGAVLGLEALVGHPDRLAVHFIHPPDGPEGTGWSVSDLVVTATDDLGGGYVASPEPLYGAEGGAFHLRPPLHPRATNLTVHLEGPTAVSSVAVDLRSSP